MDEKKKRFIKREIAISRVVHHPNIVMMHETIYEVTKKMQRKKRLKRNKNKIKIKIKKKDFDKEVHMIFDYIEGSALLDFIIAHSFLPEKSARPFFRHILSAVGRRKEKEKKRKREKEEKRKRGKEKKRKREKEKKRKREKEKKRKPLRRYLVVCWMII